MGGNRKRARRGRGEGTIYYDASKKLYVTQVSLGYDADGRRIRPTVYGKTKREVQEKLAQLQQNAHLGKPVKPSNLTVQQHFEDWLRTKKPPATASATYDWYRRHIKNHIIPFLGRFKVRDVTYVELNRFWEALEEKGLSRTTVAGIRSVVRMGFRDACLKGIIQMNPCDLAAKRTPGRSEVRFLTYDEQEAFLLAARGEWLEDAFLFAIHTGLRPGELFGLAWPAIDFRKKQAIIRQALHEEGGRLFLGELKTDAGYRVISLSDTAIEALRRQRKRQAEAALKAGGKWTNTHSLIFTDRRGGPLRRSNVLRRDLRRIARRASIIQMAWRLGFDHEQLLDLYKQSGEGPVRPGDQFIVNGVPFTVEAADVMEGVHLYTFRHTHVSILIDQGWDIKSIARRIGHTDEAFTLKTYAHLMPGKDEEAAEIMDRVHARREWQ